MKSHLRLARLNYQALHLLPTFGTAALLIACGDSGSGARLSGSERSGGSPGVIEPGELVVEEPGDTSTGGASPGGVNADTACEAISSQAEARFRPMDVVVVIDNSQSMEGEIDSVERNINESFAQILEQSGVDYRVIMLSAYRNARPEPGGGGNTHRVCIEPPLGPTACDARGPGDSPHNGQRFIHFDQPISSTDGPCLMLETMRSRPMEADRGRMPVRGDDPLLQGGWTAHLRPDAFKAFVMIGDDTVDCQAQGVDFEALSAEEAAVEFDRALRNSAPEQFGAMELERRYAWHSIIGVAPNSDPLAVYEPNEEIVGKMCDGAVNVGAPHQALSRLTEGLRYPVCNTESYDAVFRRIATEVVEGASLPCSWQIPSPPDGQTFDKDRVNLSYAPGDGSVGPELGRVDSAAACAANLAWYYDNPAAPTAVHACPAVCERFMGDTTGKVDLLFGCATKPPKAPK